MTTRRATLADVAREAGVAASTVSVVFSGRSPVSDATRLRVLAAAEHLGYTGPDPRAASLRRGRSGIVGVVIDGRLGAAFLDPVMRLMMDGLSAGVAALGSGLLLLRDRGGAEPSLRNAPIDAAVLFGASAALREEAAILRARGTPVVVIEGDGGDGVPQIRLDNREAQRRLADHLAELGHRDVAIVTLPVNADRVRGRIETGGEGDIRIDITRDRLAGARDVFADAPAYASSGSLIDEGLAVGRIILADGGTPPTAVIAQSDLLAAGVIRAAEEAGLRVPDDLSVTGFDGIVVDGLAPYELTTVVQPATEKGRAAGEAIAAMLEGRDAASLRFDSVFRPGSTTAPPRRR